ncbi:cytochrome d ubiquinol oxidase subunit II [Acidihalobacter ferrooxydans]|uniref:Cytochrome d ubiquinol oxidase subunit II n=1 Tax=Acidihalobacter ferrooxydans TaxID=1765967 RepID=A0A1P8UI22_9GAMM|nr:cytochrome d ubiquinol oxidase subunit II [Acidihalobacter ferrooxydans]APZ43444.1 cytochrome d ubiquinol oxidase subunit II [Acidihalobacter ferrooxydans]
MEVLTAYAILKIVWWILLGVLFAGLAIMVGMDMGVGTILRFIGRTDDERRVALNIIGPHWDGNQVWFILGGGAIFAAWPTIYGTAFSGLYVVMLLLLWSMIVRPLGFEYRSKLPSAKWRNIWDWTLFISGFVPMLVYGAAFGNVMVGFPFHFSLQGTAISVYTGSFITLFNPFAVLMGLLSVSLSVYMGAAMVMGRAEGAMKERARTLVTVAGPVALVLFTIGGVWVAMMKGFTFSGPVDPGMPANPTIGLPVVQESGAWLSNFKHVPILWVLPLLTYLAVITGFIGARADRFQLTWWAGAVAWIGVLGTVAAATFPFMMPSYADPAHSLTIWNSGSSELTLWWMLGWTLVFVPAILIYTSWCFWIMRGKVSAEHVQADDHAY